MKYTYNFFRSVMDVAPPGSFGSDAVTVVSGLPRSGTSMMMQILQAGGLAPLTDGIRVADSRNARGYFEFEAVKSPATYGEWLMDARGKVVKVVSRFVPHLPATQFYNVVFMVRDLDQVIRSQQDMATHVSGAALNEGQGGDLLCAYKKHLQEVLHWIDCRPNFRICPVLYQEVIDAPEATLRTVRDFLAGRDLDHAAMVEQVAPSLAHQT
jgi:hypothetical protein